MKELLLGGLLIVSQCSGYEFYGQYEQDRYLYENVFHNKKNGVFIEFGALDGIRFSNTYFFEKNFGWSGICAEPNPVLFPKLKQNRNCICIDGCISDTPGIKEFFLIHGYGVGLSGLIEKYTESRVEILKEEIAPYQSTYETIKVPCYRFNDVLNKYGISHVDFMSIDIEGGEYDILKSIDFERFTIDVICVEVHYKDGKIKSFLKQKGYSHLVDIGVDELYKRDAM